MLPSTEEKPRSSDWAEYSKPALVRLLDYIYERQERRERPQSDDDYFFNSPLSRKRALEYLEEFTEEASCNHIEARLDSIRSELTALRDGKSPSKKVQIRRIELQDEMERLWKRRRRLSDKRMKRLDELIESLTVTTAEGGQTSGDGCAKRDNSVPSV